MKGEISRTSYKTGGSWDNRMQVVVTVSNGSKHVFNFINYNDDAHSHIIYTPYGTRDYARTYDSGENYEHSYSTRLADWYNAIEVRSFPYTFEQKNSFSLDSLNKEELLELKKYLNSLKDAETISMTR